jgi:hypothetical protein
MYKCCICEKETYAGRYCIACLDKEAPQQLGLDDLAAAIGVYANAIVKQNEQDKESLNKQLLEIGKPIDTKGLI